jgi:GNAT superfamily N-acetyltransferase
LTTSARVRRITALELEPLLKLYHYLHPAEDFSHNYTHLSRVWEEICADDKLHYFCIEMDGQLVSTCTLTIIPNLTRMGRPYGLIENVVTHPDYRKQGLGTEVLHHALNIAWEHGCYKVMLMTGSKREETLLFYEKAGFKRDIKTGFVAYPDVEATK